MAAAIAQHLAGAVGAGYDQQALVGDDGFFDGTSGPLTEPDRPRRREHLRQLFGR